MGGLRDAFARLLLPFRFLDRFLLPSGRYLFPATIPIMLVVAHTPNNPAATKLAI